MIYVAEDINYLMLFAPALDLFQKLNSDTKMVLNYRILL